MNYFRYTLAGLLILYVIYSTFFFIDNEFFGEKIKDCGIVTFKSTYDQKHKNSSTVEFVMVVDYDNRGKEDVDVSAATWSSYNVGERICFIIDKPTDDTLFKTITTIIGLLGFAMLAVGILIFGIFGGIAWIFTGKYFDWD